MSEEKSAPAHNEDMETIRLARKRMAQVVFVLAAQAGTLFLASGRWRWPAAWAYIGVYLGSMALNRFVFLRKSLALIAERGQIKAGTKDWDRVLAAIVSLFGPLATLLAAGLDERRRRASSVPLPARLAGLAAMVLGFTLVGWAMASNRFFAGVVRIQTERGHVVTTSGPYHYVRHPGYVGLGAHLLGTPLLLGSKRAFLPAALTVALLVLRTALEDRTLLKELPGYEEYARQVRYRLLPGVW